MSRAFKFGVKLALDMSDPRLLGGGAGAALGAGIGGLAGLVNPGVDENGKRKSRLGAAMRGALGGGAIGGLGGAAAGHFGGQQMLGAKDKIMELLSKSMSPAKAPGVAMPEPKYREVPDQPYDDETAAKNYQEARRNLNAYGGLGDRLKPPTQREQMLYPNAPAMTAEPR